MKNKTKPPVRATYATVPLWVPFTREEKTRLDATPRMSLKRLSDGMGDNIDIYNLSFRLMIGLNMAKSTYIQQTVDEMQEVFDTCMRCLVRNIQQDGAFDVTPKEHEMMEAGLDAVKQMFEENTRGVVANACKHVRQNISDAMLQRNIILKNTSKV